MVMKMIPKFCTEYPNMKSHFYLHLNLKRGFLQIQPRRALIPIPNMRSEEQYQQKGVS